VWRDALLVAGKDLRIELRSKVSLNQVVPFSLVVVVIFGLALGPDPTRLRLAAAGLFWVAAVFSTMLSVQRSYAIEPAGDARDHLRLSGLDAGGIFLGKAVAVAVELLVLEFLLGLATAFLYGVSFTGLAVLILGAIAATAGLSAVGTLYGVIATGARSRETLLPLLFFPVIAPVVLAASKAYNDALSHSPGAASGWLVLLAVFAACYIAIGSVAFGPLLEDA
jgi:heme exporter protein B